MLDDKPSLQLVSDRLIDEVAGEAVFDVADATGTHRLTVAYTPGDGGTPPVIDAARWNGSGACALTFATEEQARIEAALTR